MCKQCHIIRYVLSYISISSTNYDHTNHYVPYINLYVHIIIQWDTAGQERYHTLTVSYYKKSQGILLVYDVTNRESFENTRKWMQQIVLNADASVNKVLIGNKCDLSDRRVTFL